MPVPYEDVLALERFETPRLKGVAWSCGLWRFTVSLWALFTQLTSTSPSNFQISHQRNQYSDLSVNEPHFFDGPPLPALVRRLTVPLLLMLLFTNIGYLTGIAYQDTTVMRVSIIFQVIVQAILALGLLGSGLSAPTPFRHALDIIIDFGLVLLMGMYCVAYEEILQKAAARSNTAPNAHFSQ